LERAFNRLRTAIGKVHAREFRRQQLGQPARKSNLALDYELAINLTLQMADAPAPRSRQLLRDAHVERRDAIPAMKSKYARRRGYQPRTSARKSPAQEARQKFEPGSAKYFTSSLIATPPSCRGTRRHRDAKQRGDCISPGAAM